MASAPVKWTDNEIIVVAELVHRRGWRDLRATDPEVIELSEMLRSLPMNREHARDPKFRSPTSVSRKVADVVSARPGYPKKRTKGGQATVTIVEAFVESPAAFTSIANSTRVDWAEAIAVSADPYAPGDVDLMEDDDAGSLEGRVRKVAHFRRERDPKLRRQKIAAVLKAGGALACEACGFDFFDFYGERGREYIEVHHVTPLHASGETTTYLTDLAVVCANCHRMIHRRTPFLTPDELRALIRRTA